jgi:diguanylate cyclase (GGDEF)-like protein
LVNASGRRRAAVAPRTGPAVDGDLASDLRRAASAAGDEALVGLDAAGRVRAWNPAATRLLGWSEEEALGRLSTVIFPDAGGGTWAAGRHRTTVVNRHGTEIPVSLVAAPLGGGEGVSLLLLDRREAAEAQAQLARATEALDRQRALWDLLGRLSALAEGASELTGVLHRYILELCECFGWPFAHAQVLPGGERTEPVELWYLADRERLEPLRRAVHAAGGSPLAHRAIATGQVVTADGWSGDPGGPLATAGALGLDRGVAFPVGLDGRVVAVVELLGGAPAIHGPHLAVCARHASAQLGRVADRERSRDQLLHLALYDPLTGLPNRMLFMDRLTQVLRRMRPGREDVGGQLPARAPASPLAVLLVDLDHFKLINDSVGHDVGDHVLDVVAHRLAGALRPGDTAARFGGDEFIILCEGLPDEDAVGDVADRLLEAVAQPVELAAGTETVVTASVGIAIASGGDQAERLVRDADAALHRAKEEGRHRFSVFEPVLHDRARLKLTLGSQLRQALAQGELRLVYQPQFRLTDGALIGVEALARWEHPQRGTLPPSAWIPLAEESQLIVPIGRWVVSEACRVGARWIDLTGVRSGPDALSVAVNVSAVALGRPELVDDVLGALRASGLAPAHLCLEVTESVLMSSPGVYLEALLGLKLLGVTIAIDDFGTGYSSLAYLRRFPIDLIKVDKGFVDGLHAADQRGQAILRAVIALAEALGVDSVAEGVETAEQAQILTDSGCYGAQGFYFGRPQSAEQITELIQARRP